MNIKFDKVKVNKVPETNSFRNVWLANYARGCIYFDVGDTLRIERMLKEQFPDCRFSSEDSHYGQKIHVSFSDADEAFFLLWASNGVETRR